MRIEQHLRQAPCQILLPTLFLHAPSCNSITSSILLRFPVEWILVQMGNDKHDSAFYTHLFLLNRFTNRFTCNIPVLGHIIESNTCSEVVMATKSSGPKKTYLTVETKTTPEGDIIPHELTYNDETFEIHDLVKSMKLFEGAVRWRCKIDGRAVEIFNLDDRWWLER
jgi:hypothetical protein